MTVAVVATIMAIIHVGIRDLKNRAPQLVRRAARGDRIVITRYGKPRALLGPIVEAQEPGHRARMQAWQRERRALVTARRAETHGDHGCRRLERMAEAAPHSIAKPGMSTVGDGVPTRPMKNVAPRRRFQTRSNSRS